MKDKILECLDQESMGIVESMRRMADASNVPAYLVGGGVRDLILGLPSVDLDFVFEGNGMRMAESFALLHPKSTLVRYPAFKTATVVLSKTSAVDFVTARKETYRYGGALPDVVPSGIKDDLFRRDFTINAIAVAINTKVWGKVVDPFKGAQDIASKNIRVLHAQSFIDDPTRIFRAIRLSVRLGFPIETATLGYLTKALATDVLSTIKEQRIQKEIDKIKKEQNPQAVFERMAALGISLKEG